MGSRHIADHTARSSEHTSKFRPARPRHHPHQNDRMTGAGSVSQLCGPTRGRHRLRRQAADRHRQQLAQRSASTPAAAKSPASSPTRPRSFDLFPFPQIRENCSPFFGQFLVIYKSPYSRGVRRPYREKGQAVQRHHRVGVVGASATVNQGGYRQSTAGTNGGKRSAPPRHEMVRTPQGTPLPYHGSLMGRAVTKRLSRHTHTVNHGAFEELPSASHGGNGLGTPSPNGCRGQRCPSANGCFGSPLR